jgi:hypothetical protein
MYVLPAAVLIILLIIQFLPDSSSVYGVPSKTRRMKLNASITRTYACLSVSGKGDPSFEAKRHLLDRYSFLYLSTICPIAAAEYLG